MALPIVKADARDILPPMPAKLISGAMVGLKPALDQKYPMALSATICKADINVVDIDRHYYH